MSWHSHSTAAFPLVVLAASFGAVPLDAAAPDRESAEKLVAEALHREIYGLHADRERLLLEAVAADPDYPPARWHQGFVRIGGQWAHVYDAPRLLHSGSKLASYRKLREERGDSFEDHLQLADWCRARRMPDQERAHLTRVLDFNPDHADARERLGFQLVSGQWIRAAESQRQAERRASRQASLDSWRETVLELRRDLTQSNLEKRTRAVSRIRQIDSADAIPALEEILAPHSQAAAQLVLEAVAQMPEQEAVESLIRHAIFSPWIEVRDEASLQLKSRRRESFVPILLAEMYTPVESRAAVGPASGRLVYQHAFAREGQDQRQVLVLNSVYRRRAIPGADVRETLSRAYADTFATAVLLQQSAQQQNTATRLLNERIARVLNLATQQNLPATPQAWWQWWDQQNDVAVQGEKQTRTQQQTRQVVIQDRAPPQFTSPEFQGGATQAPQRAECFAAGTLVWTASGMLPIETIRVGDVVLSQEIETGELAYKPVLRTTIRPLERLIRVRAGNETFETSGGHLFWVSGQGWSQSRDLQSGHALHAIEGVVPVVAVEQGAEAQSYNLIVADFNTYVVGTAKILSHDVTNRRPTPAIVPGYLAY